MYFNLNRQGGGMDDGQDRGMGKDQFRGKWPPLTMGLELKDKAVPSWIRTQ
jgi:hypothetical protein